MAFKGASRALTLLQKEALRGVSSRSFVTTRHRLLPQGGSDTSNAPLVGTRVLDMTRILAGPYCTMILGDLGAEVLKVERPECGDDTRIWGPPFVGEESAYFLSVNRNKKSITVNVKSEEGSTIIKELVKKSDVFVENYLPGKLDEMGLGYTQLSEVNPQLVYCSVTGYGQDGPYMSRAGYDVIAAGLGGLMHITGPEDGEPCRVGVAMTDLSTGLYAYGAIMTALLHRYKTNRGQHIDCNLLSTQVATLTHIGSNYLNCNQEARRHGNGHGSIVPYQAFKTSDSYIIIGCGNNHLFKVLCKSMDLEHLLEDKRYTENADRVENRNTLIPFLSDMYGGQTDHWTVTTRFAKKSTKEWLAHFEGCPFPFGPINSMQEVFSNEQVINNGLIQAMEHPTQGAIRVPECGDDTRIWGPPFVGEESAYFLSVNRNKKSITVNVKSEEGSTIIKELIKKSDVFVENYLPGKLDEMGLGYKHLSEVNPQLVYCSVTGYGQDGPYMSRAGYDVIAAGLGGLMHITGPEDGEPCRVGVAMTDLSTGLYAYGAIMTALLHRYKTNRGQHIDCNLLSTQVATLTHIGSNYLNCNQEARRHGNGHGSIVPYQAFKTSDSYIIIGCGNNHLFKVLCKSMDLEHLLEDKRYTENADRVENRNTLIPFLSDMYGGQTDHWTVTTRFAKKSTKEWLAHFEGCPFPFGPINSMQEVFSNEQVINNGLIQAMEHPTQGAIRVPGPAVRYSDSSVVLQGPPPTLGQHTHEVLTDLLNMSPDEIDTLRAKKVL